MSLKKLHQQDVPHAEVHVLVQEHALSEEVAQRVVRPVKVVVAKAVKDTVMAPVEEVVLVDVRVPVEQRLVMDVTELAMDAVREPVGLNVMDIVIIQIIHDEYR